MGGKQHLSLPNLSVPEMRTVSCLIFFSLLTTYFFSCGAYSKDYVKQRKNEKEWQKAVVQETFQNLGYTGCSTVEIADKCLWVLNHNGTLLRTNIDGNASSFKNYEQKRVLSIGRSNDDALLILSRDKNNIVYSKLKGSNLITYPTPIQIPTNKFETFRICGDKEKIVIADRNSIYLCGNQGWRKISIRNLHTITAPKIFVMKESVLLSTNSGEFGGIFAKLNLSDNKLQIIFEGERINDFVVDTNNVIWFLCGKTRMDKVYGALYTVKNDCPKLLCQVKCNVKTHQSTGSNWKFPCTEFGAITCNSNGKIFFATDKEGIFEFSNGKAARIIGPWNGRIPIRRLIMTDTFISLFTQTDYLLKFFPDSKNCEFKSYD